jgi:predicted dehydrogenase
MGIGIVGCGNIAGRYAADLRTYPELRLVAVTDLDTDRAATFAAEHECRAHPSLAALLADDDVAIVVNLTVHHAHYEVTRQALEAGRHVYSEKPLALQPDEAHELVRLARQRGLRLGCSPATFLGEAQQTVGRLLGAGRIGTVRAIYADVNWGRIERWHPAPEPFYDVGPLVDVGVYPVTLITAFLGPVRSVRAWGWELQAERVSIDGRTFRIGSPDLVVAGLELHSGPVVRLTTSFYVGRPSRQPGTVEFHGDDGSLLLDSFQVFDATVEIAEHAGQYQPVTPVREPYPGTAWGRGLADMVAAIRDGRPHRVNGEHAAHIVDVMAAVGQSTRRAGPVPIESSFAQPPLMDWAQKALDDGPSGGG